MAARVPSPPTFTGCPAMNSRVIHLKKEKISFSSLVEAGKGHRVGRGSASYFCLSLRQNSEEGRREGAGEVYNKQLREEVRGDFIQCFDGEVLCRV